jgi:hypothetical protein
MSQDAIVRLLGRDLLKWDARYASRSLAHLRGSARLARQALLGVISFGVVCTVSSVVLWIWHDNISWPILTAVGAFVLAAVGVLTLISSLSDLLVTQRAAHLCGYLLLEQHDRALAGLRAAITGGHAVLLYLRDFAGEELQELYLQFEGSLVHLIGDSQIMVGLGNPHGDPSLRLTPISRLAVFDQTWKEIVGDLIDGATRIIVVRGRSTENMAYELEQIGRRKAEAKTLIVDMPDAETFDLANSAYLWRVQVGQFHRFNPMVYGWLKELAFVTKPVQPQRLPRVDAPMLSRRLFYFPARWYLMGWRGLVPRSDFAFYRRGLRIPCTFDPFSDIRRELLALERRAVKSGLVVSPMRLIIEPKDPDAANAKAAALWNFEQRWRTCMENADIVLQKSETWEQMRSILRSSA